ncbi:MAG: magnesium transporter [Bradymonadia bacterium]|jgi:magnesium transporter
MKSPRKARPRPAKSGRPKRKRRWAPVKIGASPHHLHISADAHPTALNLCIFDAQSCTQGPVPLEEALVRGTGGVRWLDVVGHKDLDTLRRIATEFGMHPLALEDVVNANQRPKVEIQDDKVFIVLTPTNPDSGEREQIALYFGPGFVLSFRSVPGNWFVPVCTRLETGRGRLRHKGSDYLAYALVDAIVDQYFPLMESLSDQLDTIEDGIHRDEDDALSALHALRRRLRQLRMALWPTRDALAQLLRQDVPSIDAETIPYFRDCYDHALRLADLVETLRDGAMTLFEVHLAVSGQRLNEIMKVLTLFATIFMPLSFLVGLYGMNFERNSPFNMPELGWKFGYPALLCVLALIAGGLLFFFYKRGWLKIRD